MRNILAIAACFFVMLLSSCVSSDKMIVSPVTPESLVTKSFEQVTFSFAIPSFEKDLKDWIKKDKPSRAEISCDKNKSACEVAGTILNARGVAFSVKSSASLANDVVLYYDSKERIDCSKIIDGKSNFGCATSSNFMDMINHDDSFGDGE